MAFDRINFANRKNKVFGVNTSGTEMPSAAVIDRIIKYELDAAYGQRNSALDLKIKQDALAADTSYKDRSLGLMSARDANEAAWRDKSLNLTSARDTGDLATKLQSLELQAARDAAEAKNRDALANLTASRDANDADYRKRYLDVTNAADTWKREQGSDAISSKRATDTTQTLAGLAGTALGIWGKDAPTFDKNGIRVASEPSALSKGWSALGDWLNPIPALSPGGKESYLEGGTPYNKDYFSAMGQEQDDEYYNEPILM